MVVWLHIRYKEIKQIEPDEDKVILQSMVDHEATILKWLDMEVKGQREHSLDTIVSQLQYPLLVQKLPAT
jgi:hypothetical protein